jgi:hypothetical protein
LGSHFGKTLWEVALENRFGKWLWELALGHHFGVWDITLGSHFGRPCFGNSFWEVFSQTYDGKYQLTVVHMQLYDSLHWFNLLDTSEADNP